MNPFRCCSLLRSAVVGRRLAFSSMPSSTLTPLRPAPPPADETPTKQRARLYYQSKKRGILENDLILGRFAERHLNSLTDEQLKTYDTLINGAAHNEWDIYYWLVGTKEIPPEVDSDVLQMLKKFAWEENHDKE